MITNLKNKIRRYFGFTATETNGLFFLIPTVLLILLFPKLLRQVLIRYGPDHQQRDQQILQDWLLESQNKLKTVPETIKAPEPFDPNRLSVSEWTALGFSKKIAERITKYKRKGGQFRKKEDLLKIYGIDRTLVESYSPYLVFPVFKKKPSHNNPSPAKSVNRPKKQPIKEIVKIDLNLADTAQLKSIRGIGPVLSSRIVKYREALGGFYKMEQLNEVYGIKKEVYAKLNQKFSLNQPKIRKININEDSLKLMAQHPYLTFPISRAIIKYRYQHGDYSRIEDLQKVYLIKDSLFQKIKPYLKTILTE